MHQTSSESGRENPLTKEALRSQSVYPKEFLENHKEKLENERIKGLGDLIATVAKKTGIAKIANKIEKYTGKGCGCKKRQDNLNKIVPF